MAVAISKLQGKAQSCAPGQKTNAGQVAKGAQREVAKMHLHEVRL